MGSTRKITRAMQMVAASKLRRAQETILAARPYAQATHSTVSALAAQTEKGGLTDNLRRFFDEDKTVERHLLVVMTSQRGLCGGFNTQILRLVVQKVKALQGEGKEVFFICVGKKSADVVQRRWGKEKILASYEAEEQPLSLAETLSAQLVAMFQENKFDSCSVFFSHFHSVLNQSPTELQLIPIEKKQGVTLHSVYTYEPDVAEMLEGLLSAHLAAQLLRGCLENNAGEQGARMTAMDNATRNAEDMIEDLSLTYNRTRQAVITNELVEIISGAEAL